MSDCPMWTRGRKIETPAPTTGRIGSSRIHRASGGAGIGSGGRPPASDGSRVTTAVALPLRWLLCGAGAAFLSIRRPHPRGRRSGSWRHRGPADGSSRTGKVAGRAASIRGTTAIGRRRRPGSTRTASSCRGWSGESQIGAYDSMTGFIARRSVGGRSKPARASCCRTGNAQKPRCRFATC